MESQCCLAQYHFVSLLPVCFWVLIALGGVDNQPHGLSLDIPKNNWHGLVINAQDAAWRLYFSFQIALIKFFRWELAYVLMLWRYICFRCWVQFKITKAEMYYSIAFPYNSSPFCTGGPASLPFLCAFHSNVQTETWPFQASSHVDSSQWVATVCGHQSEQSENDIDIAHFTREENRPRDCQKLGFSCEQYWQKI